MIKSVTVQKLKHLMCDGENPVLLDVREPDERKICKIDPSIFIPMDSIYNRIDEIPRESLCVVYCHHGIRSFMVISYLEREHGFKNLINLEGGIHAWAEQIDADMEVY